jgi:hypothetical protein
MDQQAQGGVMFKQRGVSLGGFLIVCVVLFFGALLAFKVIPPYMEFLNIKKSMTATARDPTLQEASPKQVRDAYARRADVDNVRVISENDIEIAKEGGSLVLSTSYQVKVPLVYNISLLMDFAYATR